MPFWHRLVVAAVVFAAVSLLARTVDWWLARRPLPPEAATRYRVLRRGISGAILVVGLFSALLVIPEVRAVAGGLLASSAVLAAVIGFASQRTLGAVEEIGLTYTFIRMHDGALLVVPNEKLASDTIRNATIRSRETFAEVTVQVPLTADLSAAIGELRDEDSAQRLEGEPRVRVHGRLRALGVWG